MHTCETHNENHPDCVDCHKATFCRAFIPLFGVADSKGDQPASVVLALASKLAEKMEQLEAKEGREWGIALAAEATFDLAHIDKNPLPTDFVLLDPDAEETFLPGLIAPILGEGTSNGDVRRLIKGGGVKIFGLPVKDVNLPTKELNRATIVVGKQGKAIFTHFPL